MATMTQVQIEVESGVGRFLVFVRAAIVGRALRLVGMRKNLGASVRVIPNEPGAPLVGGAEGEENRGAATTGSAA